MYGGQLKNSGQILADEKFIETEVAKHGTADSAARVYANVGWSYYHRGDFKTGIKRFNQCWLLNPSEGDCYWGFGVYEGVGGRTSSAIQFLEKANELTSNNARLVSELALAYLQLAAENEKDTTVFQSNMKKAVALLEMAAIQSPKEDKVYCIWALVEDKWGHSESVCRLIPKCKNDKNGLRSKNECN